MAKQRLNGRALWENHISMICTNLSFLLQWALKIRAITLYLFCAYNSDVLNICCLLGTFLCFLLIITKPLKMGFILQMKPRECIAQSHSQWASKQYCIQTHSRSSLASTGTSNSLCANFVISTPPPKMCLF
jgi:hypothetical protein